MFKRLYILYVLTLIHIKITIVNFHITILDTLYSSYSGEVGNNVTQINEYKRIIFILYRYI